MHAVSEFSTDGLRGRRKVEYWNDLATSAMTAMAADPDDVSTFCGRMRRAQFGEVRVVEVFSHGAHVQRSSKHIASSSETAFLLELQLNGISATRQGSREAHLEAGDFTLLDSARPFQVCCTDPMKLLVLKLPRVTLAKYLGCPEAMTAITMRATRAPNELASQFLQNLWSRSQTTLDSTRATHPVRAALELLAYAYGALAAGQESFTGAAEAYRVRIVDHIETHLSDPELNPESIAAALRISRRYLHQVWKCSGIEPLARYVLRRRLEECARSLRDPLQSRRSITAIAFDWGFVGMPHFCSAFREQFDVTAGEYRASAAS